MFRVPFIAFFDSCGFSVCPALSVRSYRVFTGAVSRLVRFIPAVVNFVAVSVQPDAAAVSARELRNATRRHRCGHQECCRQHYCEAVQLQLHGHLHLRNNMKHTPVTQKKFLIYVSTEEGGRMGKEEKVIGKVNEVDHSDDKDGDGQR